MANLGQCGMCFNVSYSFGIQNQNINELWLIQFSWCWKCFCKGYEIMVTQVWIKYVFKELWCVKILTHEFSKHGNCDKCDPQI
jgi:hypothetical protein